ncbi:hypothetical protein NDU88_013168 [Pleurodeles waltl]|uniref:Uncharacterized protein n=1 Tax=Pleurodeles waltl TaxID=8319 RepID=A0AAV7R294_PLEWA|nr:hypothetical protein NDU88_013168 [Pleurodeles waltl]
MRVPVEQGDQVQESRQSRDWTDAQEMPAEGAKELPLDGRSCGFCKNEEGLKLPLWRMDVSRREEACRGVPTQKDRKQALQAARLAGEDSVDPLEISSELLVSRRTARREPSVRHRPRVRLGPRFAS